MRIAFDLDDTLVPALRDFPTERPARRLLGRLLTRTPVRRGTTQLMRTLTAQEHEIWIYTTSYRSPFRVRQCFNISGVRISGVVNGDVHAECVKVTCSKYPPTFGIDVLVDDSPGVAAEGDRHGFRVIQIDPDDENWVTRVLREVAAIDGRCL